MFSEDLLIDEGLFQDGEMSEKKALFRHIANKYRKPTIPQLNNKGLAASKMNVLYYHAQKCEALVILLQKTYCMQKSGYF